MEASSGEGWVAQMGIVRRVSPAASLLEALLSKERLARLAASEMWASESTLQQCRPASTLAAPAHQGFSSITWIYRMLLVCVIMASECVSVHQMAYVCYSMGCGSLTAWRRAPGGWPLVVRSFMTSASTWSFKSGRVLCWAMRKTATRSLQKKEAPKKRNVSIKSIKASALPILACQLLNCFNI